MLILDYLRWWYGRGWFNLPAYFELRIVHTYQDFSVSILLSTLFAPWRRTIEVGQRTMGERAKAALGNLVSRGVGLTVRAGALLTALLLIMIEAVVGFIIFIAWPLLPLASVILMIRGVS